MKNCCYGEQLITVGTAIAFKIAECTDSDQLGILGALLSVVGDQLSLLADTKEICSNTTSADI